MPQEDVLQLFWTGHAGFCEESSIVKTFVPNGQLRRFSFELPVGARGPLRLAPGSRPYYGQIESILVTALGASGAPGSGFVASLTGADAFASLAAANDIIPIPADGAYRFISLGTDPQLLVSVALSNDQHIQHVVEVTLRLWEDSRDALFGEIARLGHAVSRTQENVRLKDRRIIELEGELLESQDRFAHEIRGANEYAESIRSSLMLALEESETRMGALIEELLIKDKELRGTREELDRIKTSTGWRLLRSYGKVKHGLFVPALTRARALKSGASAELHSGAGSNGAPPGPAAGARPGEASAGHLKSIAPLYHVRRDGEGQWKSFGIDPQLGIPPPYPTGWVKVVVHIDSTDRARDHCRLYLGIDQEHAEDCSYDLGQVNAEHVTYVHIGENVTGLRLDPVEGPGAFSIRTLQLVPATPEESAQAIESRSEDPPLTPPAMPGGFEPPPRLELSDAWFEVNEWNGRREQILRQRLGELESEPLISVVMPVFNAPPKYLDLAIQSVANQVYRNWELCIADDASTNESIKKLLTDWTARDRRVRPVFLPANRGISSASNAGAEIALGEYLLFMDHDDELSPDALAEMALYLAEHAETDVLYADEDKIDPSGRRYDLSFKPDWSPELFLSYNYINHPLLIRKTLFRDVGAFRTEFNFAQDWDLGLRATEVARHIGHIPAVLYHWRALPTSIASNGKSKPEVLKSAGLALEDALRRRAIGAEVFQPDWAIETACGYYAHRFPHNGPSVAILIPTKNNFRILRKCIDSLALTAYSNYEIVIIDNGSDEAETLEYLAATPYKVLTIPSPEGKFSFAAINNEAVSRVSTDYILFLNDDTEVLSADWLCQMVGYLGIPGVGAVGARLLYPDGTVQHAGVIHGRLDDGPWHAFKRAASDDPGYLGYSLVARNYSAVTAACMLTPRGLLLEMGGFDEEAFPVAYNDVDYCYRLVNSGYRIVYCPSARLTHHESYSRGLRGDPRELARILSRYRGFRERYYSPHLSDTVVSIQARTIATSVRNPISTLVCTHNLNIEGAPLVQLELTLGLKDRGVIDPVVYSPQDGPLRAEYERRGVRVEIHPHPVRWVAPTPEGYKFGIETLARWAKSLGVDLVYGNTLQTFYAIEAARIAGLPSVWNPRESEDWRVYFNEFGPVAALNALECFSYPYQVVFVSKASKNTFLDLCSHRNFAHIHDGLDRAAFLAMLARTPRCEARHRLGLGEDEIAIITVGSICERKGQLDIIGAVAAMDDETVRRIRWFIIGDRPHPYSTDLHAAWEALDVARGQRLTIVPETPDVAIYYSAADVFVCTSRVESFPRVILEAEAAGLPIVTTPAFGIAEEVFVDHNAIFIGPGDVAGLAGAVSSLVAAPTLRRRMGAMSRTVLDIITDYNSMVEAYADVFREAWLSGKPRGSDVAGNMNAD